MANESESAYAEYARKTGNNPNPDDPLGGAAGLNSLDLASNTRGVEGLLRINESRNQEQKRVLEEREQAERNFDDFYSGRKQEAFDPTVAEEYKNKVEPWRFERSLKKLQDQTFDRNAFGAPILDKYVGDNQNAFQNLTNYQNRDFNINQIDREDNVHVPMFNEENRDSYDLSDDEYQMMAVAGFIADSGGIPIKQAVENLDIYAATYGTRNGLKDLTYKGAFSHLKKQLNESKNLRDNDKKNFNIGRNTALAGLSEVDAFSEAVSDSRGNTQAQAMISAGRSQMLNQYGNKIPKAKLYFDELKAVSTKTKTIGEAYEESWFAPLNAFNTVKALYAGVDNPEQIEAVFEELAFMPQDDRRDIVGLMYMMAEQQSDEIDAGGFGKFGESFVRGFDTYMENLQDFGEVSGKAAANLIRSESVKKLMKERGQTEDDLISRARREVRQDLRDIKEIVAEIKSDYKFVQGIYDAARSGTYTLAASAGRGVGVALNAASMTVDNDIRLRELYPEMNPSTRWGVSLSAGTVQSGVERLQWRWFAKGFPVLTKWVAGSAIGRQASAALIRIGATVATENAEESIQAWTLPAMQEVWKAFGADVPSVTDEDWDESLFIYDERTFFATLPLAVLGAGSRAVYDNYGAKQSAELLSNVDMMLLHGIDPKVAESIAAEPDAIKKFMMFNDGVEFTNKETRVANVKAAINDGSLERLEEIEENKSFEERKQQIMETGTDEEKRIVEAQEIYIENAKKFNARIKDVGNGSYKLVYPDEAVRATEVFQSKEDANAALDAFHREGQESLLSQISSGEVNRLEMDKQKAILEKKHEGAEVQLEQNLLNLFDWAKGNEVRMKQAIERVRHDIDPSGTMEITEADVRDYQIKGEVRLKNLTRGYVARVAKGGNIAELVEEGAEGFMRDLIRSGFVEEKWVKEQIIKYQKDTGTNISGAEAASDMTYNQMVEAFSDLAVANFWNVYQDNHTGKLGGLINALRRFFANVARIALDLNTIRAQGKLDADFETLLDQSVGIGEEEDFERRVGEANKKIIEEYTFAVAPDPDRRGEGQGEPLTSREIDLEIEDEAGTTVRSEINTDKLADDLARKLPLQKKAQDDVTFSIAPHNPSLAVDAWRQIHPKDLKGKKWFAFFADRMMVGNYTGLDPESGINIPVHGGMDFPAIQENFDNEAGWAVSNDTMHNSLAKGADETDGIAVVVAYGKGNVTGNRSFNHIYFAELKWNIKSKKIHKKKALEFLNEIRNSIPIQRAAAKKINGWGKKFQSDWKTLEAAESALHDSTFDIRGGKFYMTEWKTTKARGHHFRSAGLGSVGRVEAGMPDIVRMVEKLEDSRFDNYAYGELMGAVEIQQGQYGKSQTAKEVGNVPHYSYEKVVKGKPYGLFPSGLHIADYIEPDKVSGRVLGGQAIAARVTFSIGKQEKAFYSKMEQVLDRKIQGKQASPEQIKAIIDPSKGSGVKAEEIKWTGIRAKVDELATENNGKVPKAELMEWLKNEAAVQFEEVVQEVVNEYKIQQDLEDVLTEYDLYSDTGMDGELLFYNNADSEGDRSLDYDELPSDVVNVAEAYNRMTEGDTEGASFAEYQLPNGENYKETVLTMPPTLPSNLEVNKADDGWYVEEKGKAGEGAFGFGNSEQAAISDYVRNQGVKGYTSSHFRDIPNYVAHMRTNERQDSTGARGLLSEEYQSDLHQAARKQGYSESVDRGDIIIQTQGIVDQDRKAIIDLQTLIENVRSEIAGRKEEEAVKGDMMNVGRIQSLEMQLEGLEGDLEFAQDMLAVNLESLEGYKSGKKALPKTSGITDAPFRKDWSLQLFKRQLRDAVALGLDWVGWTTGQTQNERYDLSKVIDNVTYSQQQHQGETVYHILVQDKQNKTIDAKKYLTLSKLEELIGKDLAQKIVDGAGESSETSSFHSNLEVKKLGGIDLAVGGSGMKGFYDNMLPNTIGKYVKPWGGKVEDGKLDVDNKFGQEDENLLAELYDRDAKDIPAQRKVSFHKVKITDAMRESVKTVGQPSFSVERNPQEAIVDEYKERFPEWDITIDPYMQYEGQHDISAKRGDIRVAGWVTHPEAFRRVVAHELGHGLFPHISNKAAGTVTLGWDRDEVLSIDEDPNFPKAVMGAEAAQLAWEKPFSRHMREEKKHSPRWSSLRFVAETIAELFAVLDTGGRVLATAKQANPEIVELGLRMFADENVLRDDTTMAISPAREAQDADIVWDRNEGWGNVPNQKQIKYFGFTKSMSPFMFRNLVPDGVSGALTLSEIRKEKPSLAPPFLLVDWDDSKKAWLVRNHEGRSRAKYAMHLNDADIPVDLLTYPMRAKGLTEEMKNAPIIPQGGGDAVMAGKVVETGWTPVSMSISRKGDAAQQKINSLMRDPEARLEIYTRMSDMLAKTRARVYEKQIALGGATAASMQEADSEMDERDFILTSIAELQAITNALPMEVRPKVGGINEIAKKKTTRGKLRVLLDRIDRADRLLDKYISDKYVQKLTRLRNQAKPKKPKGAKVEKGTITAPKHVEAELIEGVLAMTDAQVDEEVDKNENILMNPKTEIEDATEATLNILRLQTYGKLMREGSRLQANASIMKEAVDQLESLVRDGKAAYAVLQEEKAQRREAQLEEFIDVVSGGKGVPDADERARFAAKRKKQYTRGHVLEFKAKMSSWEHLIEHISRLDNSKSMESRIRVWAEKVHRATHDESMAVATKTVEFERAVAKIYGIDPDKEKMTWQVKTTKIFEQIAEPFERNISRSYVNDKQVVKLTPEHAAEIVAGLNETILLKEGLAKVTKEDIAAIEESMKKHPKAKTVKFTKEKHTGEKNMFLSVDNILNLTMLYGQEGYRELLEYHGYTNEVMQKLEGELSVKEKRVRAYMLEKNDKNYDYFNNIYSKVFGVNMRKVKNYSKGTFEHHGVTPVELMDSGGKTAMSITPSSGMARIQHLAEPKQTAGAIALFLETIRETEHFVAWAEVIGDIRSTFLNKKAQDTIEAYHGEMFRKQLNRSIEEFTEGGDKVDSNSRYKLVDRLRSDFTVMSLAYKWHIVLKQFSSLPAYASHIPLADYAKYQAEFFTSLEHVKKMSTLPYTKHRFATGNTRDVMMVLAHHGKRSGLERAVDFGMKGVAIGDIVPVIMGGYAAYRHGYEKAKAENPENGEAFWEKRGILAFEMLTDNAQQSGYLKDLSGFAKAGSLPRVMTMYSTSLIQYTNNELSAITDLLAGRIGSKQKLAKILFINHALLPSFFYWISYMTANAARAEGDEESLEDAKAGWYKSMLLGSASGVYIFGKQLSSMATGYTYSLPVFAGLESTGRAIHKTYDMLFEDESITPDDFLEAINHWFDAVAYIRGKGLGKAFEVAKNVSKSVGFDRHDAKRLAMNDVDAAVYDMSKIKRQLYKLHEMPDKEEDSLAWRRAQRERWYSLADEYSLYLQENELDEDVWREVEDVLKEKGILPVQVRRRVR